MLTQIILLDDITPRYNDNNNNNEYGLSINVVRLGEGGSLEAACLQTPETHGGRE